jgi:hypothetical protein
MNIKLIHAHPLRWLYRKAFLRQVGGAAVIRDRRMFSDADAWKPFPFRDGEIVSEE